MLITLNIDTLEKKKILIGGGAGFIGSVLSPYLQKAGHDVTVVDACWFGNHLPDNIRLIRKDLFDLTIDEVKEFDTFIFLGGLSNDPMAEFAPQQNFIYNTALPAYLGFIAREAGIKRFIYAGSCSVYGYTHNKTFTEEDIAICNYPYGASKLQGEQAVLSLVSEDFSVICFRQGTICGYSPRMRFDLAINTMFKNAITKKEIQLSNHRIWRPILGLQDLCNGYRLAVECPAEANGVFNLASFNTTVGELANSVVEIVEKEYKTTISVIDRNIQDYRNYKVSWQKASDILHYHPEQQVSNIIYTLIEHLSEYGDYEQLKYYNIEVFKQIILNTHEIRFSS